MVLESKRMKEDDDDRLSALPDDLILTILSFVGLKDAIRTSVLSPRWRYAWTSVPHLNFSSEDFPAMDELSDFVTHVLSRRSDNDQLSSFKLHTRGNDGHDVSLRIINHAFSLNVQQLNITCLFGSHGNETGFHLSLSGSQTLKHLTLNWVSPLDHIVLASTREFSSLTTLHLYEITLSDGFLSMCPNLENLTLHRCKMTGSEEDTLSICHPRLSNLTLENDIIGAFTVNVFTPQLKNLTILKYFGRFRISAPELASLHIRGYCPYMFSNDGFRSLEKGQLSLLGLRSINRSDDSTVISLLQDFHNVKYLSLTVDVIQLLNSLVELISHQPSPLTNLKSLKILPKVSCYLRHRSKPKKVFMSAQVKNYLLSSSPNATLTEVLREKHCCDERASAAETSIKRIVSY